ncbi:hypothetical protein OROGR_031014 [Orobanche gracilis]
MELPEWTDIVKTGVLKELDPYDPDWQCYKTCSMGLCWRAISTANEQRDAVVNVYINQEKKFAFVEMRFVKEARNAIALDGIIFEGALVKLRRPSDYNPSLAATIGPGVPNPNLNLGAVGLTPGSSGALLQLRRSPKFSFYLLLERSR